VNIQEVSDILGVCRFLRAPKHVFITDEPVYEERNGRTFYRGLQPKNRRDVIFLSAQSDVTMIPHEAWHAMTGLGELTAYPVGRIVAAKYEFVKKFPRLKALFSGFTNAFVQPTIQRVTRSSLMASGGTPKA